MLNYFNFFCSACEPQAMHSGVSDVIVVRHLDKTLHNTPFFICFGTWDIVITQPIVKIRVNKVQIPFTFQIDSDGYILPRILKTEDLIKFQLIEGKNQIQYILQECILNAQIYLYEETDKLILSDYDGTLTKSDVVGLIHNLRQQHHIHQGYEKLMKQLTNFGYKIVWLTMRALPYYGFSKQYIKKYIGIDGPILMEPQQPTLAIGKQVIFSNSDIVKATIIKSIKNLFPNDSKSLAGGLGNRNNDATAYHFANIQLKDIYIVDKNSVVQRMSQTKKSTTFKQIADNLSQYFPKVPKLPKLKQRPSNNKIG